MIITAQQIDLSGGLTPAADLQRWAEKNTMTYTFKNDTLVQPDSGRNKLNCDGPFYSMNHCIVCGAPGVAAPNHIKFTDELGLTNKGDDYSCVIYRQPENINELITMIDAMDSSCVECIRYCGTNQTAIELISKSGYAHLIDKNSAQQEGACVSKQPLTSEVNLNHQPK